MGAKYYESELAYLREMGRQFALVHPSTAGLLSERGNDPDVERLLEGFAFLTARIRERADDAVPVIVHGLTELLLPQYLRPVPATSIIQYAPTPKALRAVHRVPRGTRVASRPMHGTSCEFQTTQDVDLLPLTLVGARLDETSSSRPALRLAFETTEAGRSVISRPEGIRLLLHGDHSLCATLLLWLSRYLTGASIVQSGGAAVELGRDAVVTAGFARHEALLPWPALAQEGYRYLQEYFTLPAKFLFFDVVHLHRMDLQSDAFEVVLRFERPPDLPQRLTADNFRLFCTPVINLFQTTGEPVKRDPRISEHLLRAAGVPPQHMEVYEVRSVIGIRQGQVRRREYHPFVGFAHVADEEGSYYTLRPTISPIDDGIDTYVSVAAPRSPGSVEDEEVLSFELTCTNRSIAADIQLGEICVAPRGVSSPAPFKNIAPVTVPVRPRLGSELQWRFLSHMALARTALGQPDTLKATLALYNFQKETSPSAGRANELKIQSIRDVQAQSVTRLMGGAPVRGVETRIELDEAKAGLPGEAFLFGCVLDELFASHVPINSFNELHLVLLPSRVELRWPARSGQRRIL